MTTGEFAVTQFDGDDSGEHLRVELERLGPSEVLIPQDQEFDVPPDLVPASLAKGLEFDHVVLLEPCGIVAGEADRTTGLRRLYVCLTRAVTSLVVVHAEAIPAELKEP